MKKKKETKASEEGAVEKVLTGLDKIIPGFGGFFRKAGESKVFGARIGEIRKEITRRFGGAAKK